MRVLCNHSKICFVLMYLLLLPSAIYSQISTKTPQIIYDNDSIRFADFSIYCYNLIKEQNADVLYDLLSDVEKTYATKNDVKNALDKLYPLFGEIDSLYDIYLKKIYEENMVVHEVISYYETDKERIRLRLYLSKDNENQITIHAFAGGPMPRGPKTLFSFQDASTWHYLIIILFILVSLIQIMCILFYIRFKPKRKWFYIIISLIGAPIGVKINWSTLVYAISFGFNIPAVGWGIMKSSGKTFDIRIFFPLGLLFLIDLVIYNRLQRKKQSLEKSDVQ